MERPASFSELDTARRPIEQPCAEPVLKLADPTAYRGFGHAEAFRPRSKAARRHDGNQYS